MSTTITTQAGAIALAQLRQMCANGEAQAIRENARLSAADCARHVGVGRALIRRWERGDVRPTGNRAMAYLVLLEDLACRFPNP